MLWYVFFLRDFSIVSGIKSWNLTCAECPNPLEPFPWVFGLDRELSCIQEVVWFIWPECLHIVSFWQTKATPDIPPIFIFSSFFLQVCLFLLQMATLQKVCLSLLPWYFAPDYQARSCSLGLVHFSLQKTHAYHKMVDDVPDDVKRDRLIELRNLFHAKVMEKKEVTVGREELVLVENVSSFSAFEPPALQKKMRAHAKCMHLIDFHFQVSCWTFSLWLVGRFCNLASSIAVHVNETLQRYFSLSHFAACSLLLLPVCVLKVATYYARIASVYGLSFVFVASFLLMLLLCSCLCVCMHL